MAIHSSILAWGIPWTEKPDGLRFTGSQRARYVGATKQRHQERTLKKSFSGTTDLNSRKKKKKINKKEYYNKQK